MFDKLYTKTMQKKLIGFIILLIILIGIIDVSGMVGKIISYPFIFLCGDYFILPYVFILILIFPLFKGKKIHFNISLLSFLLVIISFLILVSNHDYLINNVVDNYLMNFKQSPIPLFTNTLKGGFLGVYLFALLKTFIGNVLTILLLSLVLIFALILSLKPLIYRFVNHFYDHKEIKVETKKEAQKVELKEYQFISEQKEEPLNFNQYSPVNVQEIFNSHNNQPNSPVNVQEKQVNVVNTSVKSTYESPLFEDLTFSSEVKNNSNTDTATSFSVFDDDLGFNESSKAKNDDYFFKSNHDEVIVENKLEEKQSQQYFTDEQQVFVENVKTNVNSNHTPFDDYIEKEEPNANNDLNIFKKEDSTKTNIPSFIVNEKHEANTVNYVNEVKKEEVVQQVKPVTFSQPVNQNRAPYKLPPLSLLNNVTNDDDTKNKQDAEIKAVKLNQKLSSLSIKAHVARFIVAPSFTRYEIEVESDVKLSQFNNIKQDIMMALSAEKINILAPIPGTSFVGIEVPNIKRSVVSFKEIFEDIPLDQKNEKLLVALGKDISGKTVTVKIDKTPHMLIAGTTGSGKSVCMNTIIISLLMRTSYEEVKIILVDPKRVEMAVYANIPHLLCPVINDPIKATVALKRVVEVMDERYSLFENTGPLIKDIKRYNAYMIEHGQKPLPYIVMIIDELSDLMMIASKDVEDSIRRITQLARAAGIHLIVATQRPSVDVITGVIKANIPSRVAFATSNNADSRTILDTGGAEDLLGRGDCLIHISGDLSMSRVQGAYVSDDEIERVVDYVKRQRSPIYDPRFINLDPPKEASNFSVDGISGGDDDDDLYQMILEFLKETPTISTSLLQRKFALGFPKAARLIDRLESDGIISGPRGSKPREVYQDKL